MCGLLLTVSDDGHPDCVLSPIDSGGEDACVASAPAIVRQFSESLDPQLEPSLSLIPTQCFPPDMSFISTLSFLNAKFTTRLQRIKHNSELQLSASLSFHVSTILSITTRNCLNSGSFELPNLFMFWESAVLVSQSSRQPDFSWTMKPP
jgi:hypothetical protein